MSFERRIRPCFACGDTSHNFNNCLDIEKKESYYERHPERICQYYARGYCFKGPECSFLHFTSARRMSKDEIIARRNEFALANQQAGQMRNENKIQFSNIVIDTNQTFYGNTIPNNKRKSEKEDEIKQENSKEEKKIKKERESPVWEIDPKDKDLLVEKKEVELEMKKSNLDLVGKCGHCYSRSDQLVVGKNEDIFIFVKQQTPLTENQFYIRSTAHLKSVMGGDDAFVKRLLVYQRELSKTFDLYGTKLIFAEHYRDSPSFREHFDLGVFPFREFQFEALKQYFDGAIRIYRGDNDCRMNLIRFSGQEDFLSKKKLIAGKKEYISITFEDEGFFFLAKGDFRPKWIDSVIVYFNNPLSSLEEAVKSEFLDRSVIRKDELRSILRDFIKENC